MSGPRLDVIQSDSIALHAISSASRAHKLRLASVGALGPSTAEGSWKAEPRLPNRLYPSLIDWQAHTPWWIADYFPNLESETGMLLCIASMVPRIRSLQLPLLALSRHQCAAHVCF